MYRWRFLISVLSCCQRFKVVRETRRSRMIFKTLLFFVAICSPPSMGKPVHPKDIPLHHRMAKRKVQMCFGDDSHSGASSQSASKRFAVSPEKWDSSQLTYGVYNTGNDMSPDKVKSILKNAFKIWSDQTVLRFTYVDDASKANIKIRFVPRNHPPCSYAFDGPGNFLAHTFFPKDGDIHIDDEETFTDGTYSGTNLLSVAVHEIGHAIGIGHSSYKESIMYNYYGGYDPNLKLYADDINAVSSLYGGPTVIIPTTQPPPCVDHHSDCPQLAKACDSNDQDTMRKSCPYTCYVCRSKCEDKYSKSNCEFYKTNGLCSSAYISGNCRKTCQTPGSNC